MVDYSDIRNTSPSVAFFFARLGAFLGSPSGHCLRVGGFVLGDSGLELALVSLYPLLRQSLDWFRSMREVLRRERMGSEIRSSDLEMGLSFNAGTARTDIDTTASIPMSYHLSISPPSRPFHALKEKCSLNKETLGRGLNLGSGNP